MDNLVEYGDILKGESKTKEILELINRINEGKYNDALMPNELAGVIISIGELYSGQLKQNKNVASVEDFENIILDCDDYPTKYVKHKNLSAALKIVKETNAAARLSYEERYKENNGLSKAA